MKTAGALSLAKKTTRAGRDGAGVTRPRRRHDPASGPPMVTSHDPEAESLVCGMAIEFPELCAARLAATLPLDAFFCDRFARIFNRGVRPALDRGLLPDYSTVRLILHDAGEMSEIGEATLITITDGVPRSTNLEYLIGELLDYRAQRQALAVLTLAHQHVAADRRILHNGFFAETRAAIGAVEDELAARNPVAPSSFATPAYVLATQAQAAPPGALIAGLCLRETITLAHGEPRTLKSLVARECGLALVTGTAPFGLERLRVDEPQRVVYVSNEDSLARTLDSLTLLSRGRGLSTIPEGFDLAVGKNVSLDDPVWQQQLIAGTRAAGYALVMFDPLRSLTAGADQGPHELKPVTEFFRRLQGETGAAIWIVHHDTKPQVGAKDTRRKPHRASGGGIFSIADSPIHVEEVGVSQSLLTPSAWKFCEDPAAVLVRLETEDGCLRLIGEEAAGQLAGEVVLRHQIRQFLEHSPGVSGNAVAQGVKARKDRVLTTLRAMEEAGELDSVQLGKRTSWMLRRAAEASE